MRFCSIKADTARRIACILLCFLLSFAAVFTVSCNEAEPDVTEEPSSETEASTEAKSTEVPLNENGLVNVLVFTEDAPKGTKVTKNNTEIIEVSATNIPRNVVTDLLKVRNQYTNKDFYKGEYVIENRLTEEKPVIMDSSTITEEIARSSNDFIVVTDFVKANTGADLYGNLQTLIEKNPGRTLFFPDGEYIISSTLKTSSKPQGSTSFYLSSGATLKAADKWEGGAGPLIGLGALEKVNDITTPGSNFYVIGGVFDGNGKADGITIKAGRETLIKDVVIINTRYGIYIPNGTNGSSSDADIDDVTIIGNGKSTSVGIYIVGLDNTVTDARISNVAVGVRNPNGVFVANCTVENTINIPYTVGFETSGGDTWLSNCVSINFDTAFSFGSPTGIVKQCSAIWTKESETQIAFKYSGVLRSCIISCSAKFFEGSGTKMFLSANDGGCGYVVSPVFDRSMLSASDKTAAYLKDQSTIISPAPAAKKDD